MLFISLKMPLLLIQHFNLNSVNSGEGKGENPGNHVS